MSEQQRTRLYAWLREQTDEPLAEYLMACLAPAPLSDLVTKDHLSAELAQLTTKLAAKFATKEEMHAGFADLRSEIAAQRAEDRRALAAQRAEDQRAFAAQRAEDQAALAAQRAEDQAALAAQRAEDQSATRQRHYWLTGTIISVGIAVGAPTWLNALGIIG